MPLTTEELRARQREWSRRYNAKPEAKAKARDRARRYRQQNPNLYRNYKVALQEAEAGRPKTDYCEICGNTEQRIMFDHCHQRGVFRGWICINCNSILGYANDDPDHLRKVIAYIERTKDLSARQLVLPV